MTVKYPKSLYFEFYQRKHLLLKEKQKRKDFLQLDTKFIKISGTNYAKKYYKSYLKTKANKLIEKSKQRTQQPKIYGKSKHY